MAVRKEIVWLGLEGNFTTEAARNAAAAKLLAGALDDIDGGGVRAARGLETCAPKIDQVGNSARRNGPDIDKLSGRMRLLAEAGLIVGPILGPLGASTIPLLTGSIAGLASAAGGLGVTILALSGFGDALKALNEYQLEPTSENLQKLRIEEEKLGPAGAEFLRYLDSLEPVLRDLQNTAREGLLPGVEDGIDALLQRLPQIRSLVADLSEGMGNLARDAGMSLGGSDWDDFFNYLETDAQPTLEAFGQAAGNVALGLANMLAAFAPATRDFTDGLLEATQAFADWSAGLENNDSFQAFVDYVRDAGPEAVDFLVALTKAIAGILEAGAPLGDFVLGTLTQLLTVLDAIASSDAGPALYAAAAGLIAFNRAAALTDKYGPRLTATFDGLSRGRLAAGAVGGLGLLAASLTDVDEKAGLTNTTMGVTAGLLAGGPWGAAVGAAVGLAKDLSDAYDQAADAIEAADDAMRDNDRPAMLRERSNLLKQLAEDHPEEGTIGNWFDAFRGAWRDFTGQTAAARRRVDEINASFDQGGDLADLFGETIGQTGDQFRTAAAGARELSGALAQMSGWFDKRAAVRGYKDAIDELAEGLKDGFTRDDVAGLDAVGESILQVASQIKNDDNRNDFLAGARESLLDIAADGGPKAEAAVGEVIAKFDDLGLMHPKPKIGADDREWRDVTDDVARDMSIMGRSTTEPQIGADANPFAQIYGNVQGDLTSLDTTTAAPKVTAETGSAESKLDSVFGNLNVLNRTNAKPNVNVDPGNSMGILASIKNMLDSLRSKTVTLTTIHNNRGGGSVTSTAGGHSVNTSNADGGTVLGQRLPYGDKVLSWVAPGEEIISNRYGQADRFRADRAAGRIPAYADGGTIPGAPRLDGLTTRAWTDRDRDRTWIDASRAVWQVTDALGELKEKLEESRTALDAERQKRDDLISMRNSLASSTSGALVNDPFGNGLAGFQAQVDADTADTDAMLAALQTLVRNGLDPKSALFQALATSGDVTTAQQMAALTSQQLFAEQQRYAVLGEKGAALGNYVGDQAVGPEIAKLDKSVASLGREVKELAHAVRDLPKGVRDGARDGVKEGGKGWAEAVERGAARGAHSGAAAAARYRDASVTVMTRVAPRGLSWRVA